MSITRLQQARQMYALGKLVERVGFRGGGMDAGAGSDFGGGPTGGGEGGDGRPNMADITGPAPTVDMSHFGDPDSEVNVPTSQRKDTITSFLNNFNAQRKSMGLKNLLPGAQIYNVGKTALQTAQARNLLGLGPTVGPSTTDSGGGDGIMDLYSPNMMDISGEVVTEDDVTGGGMDASMSDFIQRFRGLNETRQDKLGQLDPQIIAMINKLYTTPKV